MSTVLDHLSINSRIQVEAGNGVAGSIVGLLPITRYSHLPPSAAKRKRAISPPTALMW